MITSYTKILTGLVALIAVNVHAQPQYIYTTIDYPGATATVAQGIDGTNIVGVYAQGNSALGFLYNGSKWTPIINPAGVNETSPQGISGTNIVGYFWDAQSYVHGFLFNGTTWTTLDAHDAYNNGIYRFGTHTWGITSSNVVGYYVDSNTNFHGFLYDINTTNWVILDDPLAGSGASQGTLGEGMSGTMVVGLYADSNGVNQGFLYDGTQWFSFNAPGGPNADYGAAISGSNIVSSYIDSSGKVHGFIYNFNAITFTNLDDPLAGPGGTVPYGISGNTIVGGYWDKNSNLHGFLATPANLPLSVTQSDKSVTVFWPYPSMGWSLQQNPDLSPGNWSTIGAISNDGTNNYFTAALSTGNSFFRLSHQ